MSVVTVYKNRTKIMPVDLQMDVSADVITSQIREEEALDSPLIATWSVEFLTDGIDGQCVFTLDNSQLTDITVKEGWMDVKRVSGGEPLVVHDRPILVLFRESITE